MSTKSFKNLISAWPSLSSLFEKEPDIKINAIRLDHRKITAGDLFIALKGHHIDARQFITAAIGAGAAVVLAEDDETDDFRLDVKNGVFVIYFPHLKRALSEIAARFYQTLETPLSVIGVTGTNGKTTVSQLIAQWLILLGEKTAVMGTTGNGFLGALTMSANTTGSALDIQAALADFKAQSASHVVMEVSSHGLVQERVRAVPFSAAIFTNLSRDHLDYHITMAAYADAKLRLFTKYNANVLVINADDETGRRWLSAMPLGVAVSLHAENVAKHTGPSLWLTALTYSPQGCELRFSSSHFGEGHLKCALIGEFNVSNLLLSLATLLMLGFDKNALLEKASALVPVIGRMEVFTKPHAPMVVVDYAHTPDALEKALLALKRHCKGQLWCVFGCGGERDKGKRPLMAAVAEKIADRLVLTEDNSRSEDPKQIIKEMESGMKTPQAAHVIYDRKTACAYAFSHASEGDVILIAGKGHEDYQITASGTIAYSDRETAEQLLQEKRDLQEKR